MAKKMKSKRTLRINMVDGTHKDLNILSAASINTSRENDGRIYIEQINENDWRLVWTNDLFEEFSGVKNLEMVRDDD